MTTAPVGVGIFCRAFSGMVPPEAAAAKAASHGVRHVALMAVWQELGQNGIRNRASMAAFAKAFVDHGIRVRLWGYPWAGLEREFADTLRLHKSLCGRNATGVIVNPELGYRRDRAGPAEVLMHRVVDVLDEGDDLWVSSYGHPEGVRDFPWAVFGCWGDASPQLYLDSDQASMARGLEAWKRYWSQPGQLCIPGVPAFGDHDEDRLRAWLADLLAAYQEVYGCSPPGVIAWSWPQISSREWRTLEWLAGELDARYDLSQPL